ncbi:MAG: DUF4912 domain-containing protein [Fusobacteria bacterium]|nr:DUF4912 domain-containing protein [Fusobacteriota bacterium]
MAIKDLETLTKEDLYDLAREYEIKGRTEMSKEELKEALSSIMLDEGKAKLEANLFDLGSPVIGIGASDKKLPSSLDFTKENRQPVEEHVQLTSSPFFDGDPLPEFYNENTMVLMPKNPQWVYAYWEITNSKIEELRNTYGDKLNGAKPAIRVYDVTLKDFNGNNANSYFDLELPENTRDWFIGGLNSKATYIADFGFKSQDGEFIVALRSNIVATASDFISNNIDEEWMIVEEYFKKILERSSKGRIVNGKWVGGIGASGAMLGSSEEMAGRLVRRLLMEKTSRREQLLSHLEKTMGSLAMGSLSAGSLSVSSLTAGSLSVAKGNIIKTEGKASKKDFWLRVGTELILYGATEPDATVNVLGKNIKLKEDGTFSFRYSLPVGDYDLPVVATNKDGDDTRALMPVVKRTGPENNTTV